MGSKESYSIKVFLKSFRWFLKDIFGKVNKKTMIFLVIVLIIGGLVPVIFVKVFKDFINSSIAVIKDHAPFRTMITVIFGLLLLKLSGNFSKSAVNYLSLRLNMQVWEIMQLMIVKKSAELSLESFENSEVYNQLRRAQDAVERHLFWDFSDLPNVITSLIASIGMIGYLGNVNIIFPIILVFSTIPMMLLDGKYGRKRWRLERDQTEDERKMKYYENLMTQHPAATEIRFYGLQDYLAAKWQNLFLKLSKERINLARKEFFSGILGQLNTPITMFLIMLAVVFFIMRGRLSLGDFSAYLAAVELFTSSLFVLFSGSTKVYNEMLYVNDFIRFINDSDTPDTGNSMAENTEIRTESMAPKKENEQSPLIEFKSVSYTYPGSSKPAVRDINLTIYPKECIAVVGMNGSGKTTLAKLLLGLFQPTAGEIFIHGNKVNTLEADHQCDSISAVFQDYMKYELTARENIGFGNINLLEDDQAIQKAARNGGAAEFVEKFTEKYNTVLGKAFDDNGLDISIGQWQKLAISRAYFKNANIIVLDEPTSALDPRAEADIYNQFKLITRENSVLLISHRLGSTKIADRIVVLDEGHIREEGTHDELMAIKGQYEKMYSSQAQWYN